jgi:hypothetical protein
MKKIVVSICIAMLCAFTAQAQQNPTGKITLKIQDNDGKPLPFTTIMLKSVKDSVLVKGELTTESGDCKFEKIKDGEYFIQASQVGYTTLFIPNFKIDATHKTIALGTLKLAAAGKNLQAVNITATKPYIESSAGKTVLNVENSVTAAGNTALDLLRKAPGVQVDNNENVSLRGQTVTVMIDGKLTYLSGEQLANLLKTMPGESIANIEIITSPSAKYDAAGNGGIINIKTKKGKMTGVNGTISTTLTQSVYGRYGISGNFNWRTEKFNLFGNLDQGNYPRMVTRLYDRLVTNGDGTQIAMNQDVWQRNRFKNNYLKLGLDYFLNDKNTIGVLANGYKNAFNSDLYSQTFIGKPGAAYDSLLYSGTTNRNKFDNITVNLNYKGIIDTAGGKEITFDADYAQFNSDRNVVLADSLYDSKTNLTENSNSIRNLNHNQVIIKSLKTDLVWPLTAKAKLEGGLKASFVTTTNSMQFDSLYHGQFTTIPRFSDLFDYQENILAAYGNYKQTFNKTSVQLGLRVENTNSTGHSYSTNTEVNRSYTDFFPNVAVEQPLNPKDKLTLVLSRRIERPSYGQLNPFMFYIDKYTYFKGNPYLKPQYSSIAELGYTFREKYIATFRYTRTTDMMEEFIYFDEKTGASISTERNYDNTDIASLLFTLPFDITKWWHSDNNIDASYNKYRFEDLNNVPYTKTSLNYYINTVNTITLPKDMKLEVQAYYNSPFVYGIFRGYSQYNLNMGLQKQFLNKNATVKLSVNNILRNESYRGAAEYGNMRLGIFNTWQFRTVNLYLSYRFGSTTIKAARERKTGTSDEQNRAG